MQKTEAELKYERQLKRLIIWTIAITFVFGVVVLRLYDAPLYYAVGGSLLAVIAIPFGLIALTLLCITPYEAVFFAFMLLLSFLIYGSRQLMRKKILPKPMRLIRKWLYFFRYILQELKGPYITAVIVLAIYDGLSKITVKNRWTI